MTAAIARLDKRGALDDIVIDCDAIHLERMDADHWYLGIRRGEQHVKFSIRREGKRRVEVSCYQDDIGLTDDTAPDGWRSEGHR